MLSTAQQPHRRGHRHKRSAAISGDFDSIGMDFFKSPPSNTIIQDNKEIEINSLPKDYSFGSKRFNQPQPPSLVITDENNQIEKANQSNTSRNTSNTSNTNSSSSPMKKHTRLNSWAHSLMKKDEPKQPQQSQQQQQTYQSPSPNDSYKSNQFIYGPAPTSNSQYYDIPEAIIDLDKAQELIYDPNNINSIPRKKFLHRRTESAPELEDFLKFKVFSNDQNNQLNKNNDFMNNDNNNNNNTLTTNNNKNSKNSAIFEEDEEDEDEDIISSTSSGLDSNLTNLPKNESTHSLNSNNSLNFKLQSPATMNSNSNSIFNTPTSIKTNQQQQQQQTTARRGGANAARYQSYYKNSLALSNALKSSESLSQITGSTNGTGAQSLNNKSSISSFGQNSSLYKNQHLSSASSSITSSSALNSPSRFKFESKVYDMPDKEDERHTFNQSSTSSSTSRPQASSTNISSPISSSSITSPTKPSRQIYIHKKSNSLLNSINFKIRRNSNNSLNSNLLSSISKSSTSLQNEENNEQDQDEEIGDKTLTPQFNFGEPGPELDLITMTPKINKINKNSSPDLNNYQDFEITPKSIKSDAIQETPKRTNHKKFFNWLKK
ncbi:hypothetical protein BN7_4994 [Wickerhamomyces ciferrii]|uniref:Uncharacterized protein n=1 Tax=Wickerhamomyces ciferrii (strain ATCC 14091 / BCRC 22168 / CBS 111 / JCM 3599 / NBRC 0793 / NRRL Y-1031 F-60-10) TaxID=1206466 RepID=K0KTR1_WICCF|nr:uncharacterized protein BN7_4994 [Wickerhamomyces ciferrii]CCH45412.1 hypothetical protein BN7_4994 [Wickerhamomyces ciferrii]